MFFQPPKNSPSAWLWVWPSIFCLANIYVARFCLRIKRSLYRHKFSHRNEVNSSMFRFLLTTIHCNLQRNNVDNFFTSSKIKANSHSTLLFSYPSFHQFSPTAFSFTFSFIFSFFSISPSHLHFFLIPPIHLLFMLSPVFFLVLVAFLLPTVKSQSAPTSWKWRAEVERDTTGVAEGFSLYHHSVILTIKHPEMISSKKMLQFPSSVMAQQEQSNLSLGDASEAQVGGWAPGLPCSCE